MRISVQTASPLKPKEGGDRADLYITSPPLPRFVPSLLAFQLRGPDPSSSISLQVFTESRGRGKHSATTQRREVEKSHTGMKWTFWKTSPCLSNQQHIKAMDKWKRTTALLGCTRFKSWPEECDSCHWAMIRQEAVDRVFIC